MDGGNLMSHLFGGPQNTGIIAFGGLHCGPATLGNDRNFAIFSALGILSGASSPPSAGTSEWLVGSLIYSSS